MTAVEQRLTIDDLLKFTKEQGASDLHLSEGSLPMIRVDGRLLKLDLPGLTRQGVRDLVLSSMNGEQLKRFEERWEVDFAKEIDDNTRFRCNVYRQINGVGGAYRTIPADIRSFEELGLPDAMKRLSLLERGLVLLTGPTGSGKTTSLATMVDWINQHKECHVITIEDPVEFFHSSRHSLINQRELGASTHSFANALRAALREDPDVILVGEMRDLETVSLALTAAETGHLVLATLHTSSAVKTIDRIIDIFPAEQKSQVRSMVSESLQAVVAQTLLPRKDKGRIVALEVMIATVAVRNLIRENKIYQIPSIIQAGSKVGMQSLDQHLLTLVAEGKIERSVAAQRADNPKLFLE
ncbi:MAG: twitching motility protein PilT [candidate division Zixibacteria bacterium RBG_16_53_22]|nr:MAG: twitching motility protein PilT [candidate division Zixibacteria bacterium RBG_16_53_22]